MNCCEACEEAKYLNSLVNKKELSVEEIKEILSPKLQLQLVQPQPGTFIYLLASTLAGVSNGEQL